MRNAVDGKHLYFLYNRYTGLIKIGVADNVENRVRALECAAGVKLVVLGILEGGGSLEWELHNAFADWRECGEWFRPNLDLVDLAKRPGIGSAKEVCRLYQTENRVGTLERSYDFIESQDLPREAPHPCPVTVLDERWRRRRDNALRNKQNPKPCLEHTSDSPNPATAELSC